MRVVGEAHARDLLLIGRTVDAQEAGFLDAVLAIATDVAATTPIAMATADLAEGIAAARARRAPRFTGR